MNTNPSEVAALRSEASVFNIKLTPDVSWALLRKVGDRHLALDALLMEKRPAWLKEIVDK